MGFSFLEDNIIKSDDINNAKDSKKKIRRYDIARDLRENILIHNRATYEYKP